MISGRGTLHAHLFENRATGLPRNVYWGLYLSELQGRGAGKIEAILCDWLTFPARRLDQLPDHSLKTCPHPELVECSVYRDAEHRWVQLKSLTFEAKAGNAELAVHMALRPADREPAIAGPIQVRGVVRFEGLIVVPDSLEPSPGTPEDVAKVAAPYIDIDALAPPVWDQFRYLLKPKLGRVHSSRA